MAAPPPPEGDVSRPTQEPPPLLEIAPHLQFDLNACKNQKVERIA